MSDLHMDFETRSTLDINKVGAYRYLACRDTEPWFGCYAFDDGDVQTWWPHEPCPDAVHDHVSSGGQIWAHNATFERLMFWLLLVPRYGWPKPRRDQFWCTAAMAAALALPRSLDQASRAVGLDVDKDQSGRRLMLQMAKPRKLKNVPGLHWWDDADRVSRLEAYCKQDVIVERALHHKLKALTPSERKVYLLDQTINDRGMQIDVEGVRAAKVLAEKALADLDSRMRSVTNGAVGKTTEVAKLTAWVNERGVQTDTLKAEVIEDILATWPIEGPEREALEIRQAAAKSSTKKLEAFLNRVNGDGRIRENLLYHGAGPGRWSGKGVQPQNFPRGSGQIESPADVIDWIKDGATVDDLATLGDPLTVISDCLRGFIVARPDHDLIAADESQIECRGTAWLADDFELLDQFASGDDPYCRMADDIYSRPITKADTTERFIGKQTVLGCGYGMGPPKFIVTCAKFGEKVPLELAERAVRTYREKRWKIVGMWKTVERAAISAVRNRGAIYEAHKLKYGVKNDFLWCQLPSKRQIAYCAPRLELRKTPWGEWRQTLTYMGVDSQTKRWKREDTYGGKLVENAVQGLARDTIAAAMMNVEKAGYPVILSVHDEVISEVPKSHGSLAEFVQLHCVQPAWTEGLPVAAEGWRGERYRK